MRFLGSFVDGRLWRGGIAALHIANGVDAPAPICSYHPQCLKAERGGVAQSRKLTWQVVESVKWSQLPPQEDEEMSSPPLRVRLSLSLGAGAPANDPLKIIPFRV